MYALPEGAMINGIITDEEAMIRYLSGIGAEMGILKHDALLVIDTNSIRSKVMDLPVVPEAKILEFIERELAAFTEGENNDVFDYTVMNGKLPEGGARILAVAVDRDILSVYRNTFTSAGFNLKNINIGVNALIKLSRILPQLNTGAKVLSVVDDRNLTLSLFENGAYKITNRYRLFNADDTPEWRQEIGNNISSVIQFHKGQRPEEEISAAFFAGLSAARVSALADALSFLNIGITELDLASKIKLSGKAAPRNADFEPGKNLLNLGALLKR
jgi:Tfp pilus assembly PilM family ATPase